MKSAICSCILHACTHVQPYPTPLCGSHARSLNVATFTVPTTGRRFDNHFLQPSCPLKRIPALPFFPQALLALGVQGIVAATQVTPVRQFLADLARTDCLIPQALPDFLTACGDALQSMTDGHDVQLLLLELVLEVLGEVALALPSSTEARVTLGPSLMLLLQKFLSVSMCWVRSVCRPVHDFCCPLPDSPPPPPPAEASSPPYPPNAPHTHTPAYPHPPPHTHTHPHPYTTPPISTNTPFHTLPPPLICPSILPPSPPTSRPRLPTAMCPIISFARVYWSPMTVFFDALSCKFVQFIKVTKPHAPSPTAPQNPTLSLVSKPQSPVTDPQTSEYTQAKKGYTTGGYT